MSSPREPDVLTLNYQGENNRNGPASTHLDCSQTLHLWDPFHETFSEKLSSTEIAAARQQPRNIHLSDDGEYQLVGR